jgi:hypothetical protein
MRKDNNMIIQLQRYYALWKECTAMYEEWSKDQGLSSNGVFALYSFYESNGRCTQKMISEKWNIPKQTVNTILKDLAAWIIRCLSFLNSGSAPEKTGAACPVPAIPVPSLP